MKTKTLVIATALSIAVVAGVYGILWQMMPAPTVNDYETCVAEGYPILESYPAQCKTPDGRTFTQDIGNELEKQNLIRVTSPRPGATIKSPLIIEGEARGFWFFEASFPITLIDSNGNVLATGVAQTAEEWMTENFVPFKAELQFSVPAETRGNLLLEKDNPSGLPEHSDQLRIPVIMQPNS